MSGSGSPRAGGVTPWPSVALRDLVTITSGQSPSGFRFSSKGIPYFKVEQLNRSEKFLGRTQTPYLAERAPAVARGSVVFAKRGAAIGLNRIRIFSEPSFMDTNLMALTPKSHLDAEYLFYCLSHLGLSEIADVTSIPQINNKHIYPFQIPLPSLPEQRAIVAMLSDAEGLVSACEQLISKKEDIKRGLTQELLTGRTRLPGFEGEWVSQAMGSLGDTYGGLVGKSKKDFGSGTSRFVPFMAVMEGVTVGPASLLPVHVAPGESQQAVKNGDLLFNTSSETPEELAMASVARGLPSGTYLNSFCFGLRLRPDVDTDPGFLAYLCRSDVGRGKLRALAQGATRYNLSRAKFRQMEMALPRPEEQRAIAQVLSDADAEIAAVRTRVGKARDIKQGMMQQLLSGRTRLTVPAEELAA